MARSDEMRALAHDISASHRARTSDIKELKAETRAFLNRFASDMRRLASELKEFLSGSEASRLKDFSAMMRATQGDIHAIQKATRDFLRDAKTYREKEIRGQVESIAKDTHRLLAEFDREMKELGHDLKKFLGESEATRMKDFRSLKNDIESTVAQIAKTTKGLLHEYGVERKETARAWRGTSREAVHEAPAKAAAAPRKKQKRGRPKKK